MIIDEEYVNGAGPGSRGLKGRGEKKERKKNERKKGNRWAWPAEIVTKSLILECGFH